MKTKLSVTCLALLLTVLWLHASSSNTKLNFEKALLLEEANGQLQEAIALYQRVVTEAAGDEALAAQAQLHVGMCYEKLAREEARKAYQTVVDKYPSQQEPVRIARQRLASLSPSPQAVPTITVREFLRSVGTSSDKISDPTIDDSRFVTTRDGQTFVYTDWMTGDMVVKNLFTGKARPLYGVNYTDKSEEYFTSPVLSPDEKRLACLHYTWANHDDKEVARLILDAVQGGNQEILYTCETNLAPQDWSPDGRNILIVLEAADRSLSLATVGTRDRKLQRLVTLNWDYPQRAEYSPDGRFIAYDSTKDGDRKIYLLSSDGLQERVLVDSAGEDDSPLWSLDGRFLLFRCNRSGEWGLYGLSIQDGLPMRDPFLIKPNIGQTTSLRSMTTEGKLFYGESVSEGKIIIMKRGDNNKLHGAWTVPDIRSPGSSWPNFAPGGSSLVYVVGTYKQNERSLRIVTLDGTILRAVSLPPEFQRLRRPVFSPDGRKIALDAEDRKRLPKILVLSAETGVLLKVFGFQPGSGGVQSGWSKDSRLLYVRAGNQLEAIDVETETRSSTALPGTFSYYPGGVSPDGKFQANVLYPESDPQKPYLLLRSLVDGTDKILKADDLHSYTVWDFDSKHLFFKNKGTQGRRLVRLSIEDGAIETVSGAEELALQAVSRDGKHLAFSSGTESDRRIWVVENFLPKAKTEQAAR